MFIAQLHPSIALIIKHALSCWQCLVISCVSRPAVCLTSQRTTPSTSRCPSTTCRRGWAARQSSSTTAPTPGSSSSPSSSLPCRESRSWRWVASPHETSRNIFTSQWLRKPAMWCRARPASAAGLYELLMGDLSQASTDHKSTHACQETLVPLLHTYNMYRMAMTRDHVSPSQVMVFCSTSLNTIDQVGRWLEIVEFSLVLDRHMHTK